MSLRQLQRAFAANLIDEEESLQVGLFRANKLPSKRLVNVYRNNSRASLRATLAAIHPVIQKLVGREFFRHMADRYIWAYPSKSGNLQSFGRYLSDFLADFDPVSTLPYLVDVAKLEWACHIVSRAPPLDHDAPMLWEAQPPIRLAELRFKLAPACFLITSSYPVFSIWKVNQNHHLGDNSVSLDEGQQDVLVLRWRNGVELWPLQYPDATFIQILASGENLGVAVRALIADEYEFDLKALLIKYVRSRCLVISSSDGSRQ